MKRKPSTRVKRHALKKPKRRRKTNTHPTLGMKIQDARKRKNMTQLALAHAIGYTGDDAGAYISRVESNTQAPRLDTLQRIAEALGVTVCSLL